MATVAVNKAAAPPTAPPIMAALLLTSAAEDAVGLTTTGLVEGTTGLDVVGESVGDERTGDADGFAVGLGEGLPEVGDCDGEEIAGDWLGSFVGLVVGATLG